MEKFIIDGNNVCKWYAHAFSNEISIKPLLAIIEKIIDNDDEFYCIFDAPIYHNLKDNGKSDERDILEDLVKNFPDNFYIVTASTRADGVALHNSEVYSRRIITNDLYTDYEDKYSWLRDRYNSRLIQGNFQREGLITIDKLTYGKININHNVIEQSKQIKQKLYLTNSPEINSLENEIYEKKKILDEIERQIVIKNDTIRKIYKDIEDTKSNILVLKNDEKKYIENQEFLENNIKSLKEEYSRLREELRKTNIVVNFESDYQEKTEKIKNLEKIIKDKEEEIQQINDRKQLIVEKYKKYELELKKAQEREIEEELKLSNDKQCLAKARQALGDFMALYRLPKDYIYFAGPSWEAAVKMLNIEFLKHPICEVCYRKAPTFKSLVCERCGSKSVTKNPKEILNIINQFAPIAPHSEPLEDNERDALLTKDEEKFNNTLAKLTEERDTYKEKFESQSGEFAKLKERLNRIDLVFNFERVYEKRREEMDKLEKIIKEREAEIEALNNREKSTLQVYKKYELKIKKEQEREEKEKLKRFNDKECIKNAQIAISKFLEEYGINNKNNYHVGKDMKENFIHFDGSSWENAVNTLKKSFLKYPICEECYERNSSSYLKSCTICQSKKVTSNPKEIWKIIDKCKPVK